MKRPMTVKRALLVLTIPVVTALQVAPNSPCTAVCSDEPNSPTGDKASSNTYTTDIVCQDVQYNTTDVGRKFRDCQNCLQQSAASSSGESDQNWFMYNLRFAATTCIFDYFNGTADDECTSHDTCGPIRESLSQGGLAASGSTWSYCTANDNAFLSTHLEQCTTCLRQTDNKTYLANFIVGLEAGCLQRPSPQVLIGVEGDIFSSVPAKVASHGKKPVSETITTSTSKSSSSQGRTIGIAIGVTVSGLTTIAILLFCYRRRQNQQIKKDMEKLGSPLDSRFGSISITSPNNGAYGNPYATPRIDVNETSIATYGAREVSTPLPSPPARSFQASALSRLGSRSDTPSSINTKFSKSQTSPGLDSTIPIHQAYIPSPVSATSTLGSLPFSASNDSRISPDLHGSFVPMRTLSQSARGVSRSSSTTSTRNQLVEESLRNFTPAAHATTTPESSPPLYSEFRPQPRARSRSRSTSRSRSRAPSRSGSTMPGYRDRATLLAGVGNSNASQQGPMVRPGMGPIITTQNVRRLDFEAAEHERALRRRRGEAVTPIAPTVDDSPARSEASAEMWPGNY